MSCAVIKFSRPSPERLSARIYELTQFLVEVLDFQPEDLGSDCTVVLHTSCSARREMGVHLTGRKLLGGLGQVTGAQQDHESECCGFGGTFSVLEPATSVKMGQDKVADHAAFLPGVLSRINEIFSALHVNVNGQFLRTNPKLGYVVIDVAASEAQVAELRAAMAAVPGTLRTRVLY